jgi:hypothetical protein
MRVQDSPVHPPSPEQTRLHTQWHRLSHGLPPSPVSTNHSESRSRSSFEVGPGNGEEPASAPPELPIAGTGDFYYPNISWQIPDITVTEDKPPSHSIFNARPDSGSTSATVGGKTEAALRELLEARDAVIDQRISTGRNRQNYIERRRIAMDYLVEFVKAADSLLSRIRVDQPILKDYNALQDLHKRLVESTDHLEFRENNLRKDESKTNTLEDSLLQKENTYYGPTARSYNMSPISHFIDFDEEHVADPASHSPKSRSEDEPELVRRYYERLREADSFRDDLVNFSADYERAANKRNTRRMRGETVKPSEFDFVKKYSRKRKARFRRFESARKDVLRLRQECIENGFKVDDLDIPPFDEELCPDPLTRIPEPVIKYASSLGRAVGDLRRSDNLLVKDLDTDGRVATWVNQVAHERSVVARKHHSDSEILGNTAIDHQETQRASTG